MNISPKHRDRISFLPGAEMVVIWLVAVVVVPSLLLSLFSFRAVRRQERVARQAAQHRTAALLSEAEEQLQAELRQLRSRFSIYAETLPASTPARAFSDFSSREALIESLFLLNAGGDILLPRSPPSPSPTEVPDSLEWQAAQRYEFAVGDLTQAISAYRAIASVGDRRSSYAMNAVARCAVKQGDSAAAQTAYTQLLSDASSIPTPLRLGAYYELAMWRSTLRRSPRHAQGNR